MIYFKKSDWWGMGCATCFICIDWWGKGGLRWPALSGHWLSCTGRCQYLLNMKCLMYGLLFLQLCTSLGCFGPRTFFSEKKKKKIQTNKKNKANLRDLIAATSLVILPRLDSYCRFFSPCDLEIWWMTPKNNRARLLYYTKLCASFQIHQWIQTGVTVQKRPIWVKIDNFF